MEPWWQWVCQWRCSECGYGAKNPARNHKTNVDFIRGCATKLNRYTQVYDQSDMFFFGPFNATWRSWAEVEFHTNYLSFRSHFWLGFLHFFDFFIGLNRISERRLWKATGPPSHCRASHESRFRSRRQTPKKRCYWDVSQDDKMTRWHHRWETLDESELEQEM